MTTNFKEIIDKLHKNATNEDNNKYFMRLNELNTEQKRWISKLWFDTGLSEENKLRIQLPSCYTKSGIVESSSKTYTDLLFDNSDEEVKDMVNLFLAIEADIAKQLYEKSDEWFSGGTEKMSREEFEDMITSSVRLVNRQTNVCIRVNIPISSNARNIKQKDCNLSNTCSIYNRKSEIRQLSDIKADTQILPFVEISELWMSSTSINLHVNLIECMILKETNEPQTPHLIRRINLNNIECDNDNNNNNNEHDNDNTNTSENKDLQKTHTEENPVNSTIDETLPNNTTNTKPQEHLENVELEEVTINIDNDNTNDNANYAANLKENIKHTNNQEDELEISEDELDEELNNDNDGLMEIKNFEVDENETLQLKKPDEVYKELYKAAISKAKKLRQVALEAYLDAKKIKAKFMLEDIYDSDDEEDIDFD